MLDEREREGLEEAYLQLREALPFEYDPVIVPTRKQFMSKRVEAEAVDNGIRMFDDRPTEFGYDAAIDAEKVREPETGAFGADEPQPGGFWQPPYGGAKVRRRASLAEVGPECGRHDDSMLSTLMQREVHEQTLPAEWNVARLPIDGQLEAAKKPQPSLGPLRSRRESAVDHQHLVLAVVPGEPFSVRLSDLRRADVA
jgi:hypothetical protein